MVVTEFQPIEGNYYYREHQGANHGTGPRCRGDGGRLVARPRDARLAAASTENNVFGAPGTLMGPRAQSVVCGGVGGAPCGRVGRSASRVALGVLCVVPRRCGGGSLGGSRARRPLGVACRGRSLQLGDRWRVDPAGPLALEGAAHSDHRASAVPPFPPSLSSRPLPSPCGGPRAPCVAHARAVGDHVRCSDLAPRVA